MLEQNNPDNEAKKISIHDFYFETPLYTPIKLSDLEADILNGEVDGYSHINHIDTTYSISTENNHTLDLEDFRLMYEEHGNRYGQSIPCVITPLLQCKRKGKEQLIFYVFFQKEEIQKIGQYPSLADIQFSELGKKYDNILDPEDLRDFKKAIGLASHHAGAGSFVYLRRIFERLIFTTFTDHQKILAIKEEEFSNKKMHQKIELLKDHLPSQLIAMSSIYQILSKGVHELSEEECKKYFPVIKLSIELILDEKIEIKKKAEKELKIKNELQKIHKALS